MKEKDMRPQVFKELNLSFNLDTKSGVPFYRQIIQMAEYYIGTGKLKPGDKLPTIRALSIALKVNPNTIAKAYMELEIRGIVQTQVGSGTYISSKKIDAEHDRANLKKKVEALYIELIRKAGALGAGKGELVKIIKELNTDLEDRENVREKDRGYDRRTH